MKIYRDDASPIGLLDILVMLPWLLISVLKEDLLWWFGFYYKFEIHYPVDREGLHKKGLAKSKSRLNAYQSAQNQFLWG